MYPKRTWRWAWDGGFGATENQRDMVMFEENTRRKLWKARILMDEMMMRKMMIFHENVEDFPPFSENEPGERLRLHENGRGSQFFLESNDVTRQQRRAKMMIESSHII